MTEGKQSKTLNIFCNELNCMSIVLTCFKIYYSLDLFLHCDCVNLTYRLFLISVKICFYKYSQGNQVAMVTWYQGLPGGGARTGQCLTHVPNV